MLYEMKKNYPSPIAKIQKLADLVLHNQKKKRMNEKVVQ